MSNYDANIVQVIERENVGGKLIDINRDQFLKNKDADFNPLIHKSTGSPNLSNPYAKKTGKTKPNLFLTGDFWDKMILTMPNAGEYFITSKSNLTQWLSINYGKIFGIAPANRDKAIKITNKAIFEDFRQKIFR